MMPSASHSRPSAGKATRHGPGGEASASVFTAAPRTPRPARPGGSEPAWTAEEGSSQAPHDEGPEPVRQPDRHAPPGLDQQLELGVVRVVLRHALAGVQAVLVMQWRRLEAPVLLERVRTRALLAAAVVEDLQPAAAGAAHQL